MSNATSLVLTFAAFTTAACVEPGPEPDSPTRPLAELEAGLLLSFTGSDAKLLFSDSSCSSLESSVLATYAGVSGTIDRVANWVTYENGAFHGYETVCDGVSVVWGLPSSTAPTEAIEIRDGATTWSMVVEHPRTKRTFAGITEGATLKAGAAVTLSLAPASGTLDIRNARVVFQGATTQKTLWGGEELAVVGHDLSFLVPAPTVSEPVTVWVYVPMQHTIVECSGPLSCASGSSAEQKWNVTLEP
jgi:hypothetical protein